MPLDESILGGSVPFDPSEVSSAMVNRLSDQPVGTSVDTDIAIDRLARKVLAPKPQPIQAPTSKASDPSGKIAKPDLSSFGAPLDQASGEIDRAGLPDLSQFGDPVEPPSAAPAPGTPPIVPHVTTEAPKHNAVVRGFVSGLLKENPENAAEALEGISHLAPKDFKDALGQAAKDIHGLSKLTPEEYAKKSGSMWDIKSLDDAMSWAGETFGSGMASTVPSLIGGVGGGMVGGRVGGKVGAVGGAAVGAAGPSAIMNYGSVYKALKDEKVDPEKAAEYAAWAAIPITALDVGSLGPIIGRLGGITEVKQQLARSIAKRIAAEAAKGAGREGITEGIQDVIQSATVSLASDKPFWTAETAKSAIENAVGGALVGGPMGGASGIKPDKIAPAPAAQSTPGATAAPGAGPSAGGPGPQGGPQPGSGPQPGPDVSPEAEDFIKNAQAAPNPDQGPDLSAMSEAEKIHAYAASRDSHGGASEADILKGAGFSDERIAQMSPEARVEAVIRASKRQENDATQGADQTAKTSQQSNEQQKPSPEDEEYAILRAGGYTDENIRDMSGPQRASEAKYYRDDLGIDVADAMSRFKRPQENTSGQESPQAKTDQVASGDRATPIKAATADDVVRALPSEPVSQAQAEAENYKHAHVDLEPLGLTGKNNVSIETGVGQVRKGTAPDGKAWEVRMPVAYGRIKGTRGADGQPLDIFIGPNPTSNHVFVIDQHHPGGKGFDEHKIMAGFVNPRAALEAYKGSYQDGGGDRIGHVRAMSADEFKAWIKTDTTQPIQKSEPVASTHNEATGPTTTPFTEAAPDGTVPKEAASDGAGPASASEASTESASDRSVEGEILVPAPVYVEPTQDHHDQIEAVLGQDYDRVLPADAARAAEILAENEGMSPEVAFQQAVIEGAVEQKFLTHQEAIEAYGPEVENVLEPVSEGTPRSSSDTEQAGTASEQERPGDSTETGVVSRSSEDGGEQAGEGGKRDKPNPRRKAADKSDTSGEADAAGDESETVKTKIEDAGEKIGGARKDAWIGRGLGVDDLADMTGAELDKYVTKHNIWKKPDYVQAVEDGVPPIVAALIKRIYDGITVKPNNGKYGNFSNPDDLRKHYIFALNAAREAALDAKTEADVRKINDVVGKKIAAAGLDQWDGLNTLKQTNARNSPLWISSRDVRWAQKAVEAGFPNAEPWTRLFHVSQSHKFDDSKRTWMRDDKGQPVYEWKVYRKNGGVIGGAYDTKEDAEEAAKAAYEALPDDRKKGGEEPKRPHLDNVERSGPDYRNGRNVTGDDFIKDFGFRGVEFGNWVAGDERQKVVNLAYDALHDLARTLNLPPKAMSLDGTLSVAFGARGRGGRAAAHYEADRAVINMTKLAGAGSLAHEWGHALDHYLGEQHSMAPYKGAVQSISGWRDTPKDVSGHYSYNDFIGRNARMPKRLREASNRLMDTLFNKYETDEAFEVRSRKELEAKKSGQQSWIKRVELIKSRMQKGGSRAGLKQAEDQVEIWGRSIAAFERSIAKGQKKSVPTNFLEQATALSGTTGDYWRRPNELFARSFESYVFDKIAAEGFSSQYLVQGVEPTRYGSGFKGNPYPTGDERTAINKAYDRLFRAMTAGEGKHGTNTRIQSAEGEPEPVETVEKVVKPQAQPSAKQEADAVADSSKPKALAGAFVSHFMMGNKFENILQARKFAKDAGFEADSKSVEEAIEHAIVRIARQEIASSASPNAAYRLLVDYYNSQPRLGTRTSTSVRDQAYSTPVPLGYLAQVLAGVTKDTTVLEPTAGNGALLTAADPAKVLANELNPDRRANLEAQGFKSTQWDASAKDIFARLTKRDVVIANPPFGAVNENGASKVFDMSDIQPGYQTHEIDHAIALRALAAMKDDGRAVLIIGGVNKMVTTESGRSDAYNGKAKRQFFKVLYDNYNVTDHFTVSGDLYERQGAAWPVDVIVIEGRGKSKRPLPAADVPLIYDSWDSLGGLINGVRRQETGNARPDQGPADQPAGAGPGLEGRGGRDRADAGSERGGNEQPGGVRAKRGTATDAGAGATGDQERVSADAGDRSARSGEQPAAERPSRGLSDDFDDIFKDALDAAYGKEEQSDARGQPIIGTGVVLRTKSGRETSPAPKIDGGTERKTKTAIFNLDSWLLDEARKEVSGNDYQTTLLKGLNPKNFSQSDRDTVNSLLFGDPDGPRPSDIVRTEGPAKKSRADRSTEDVAKSAAESATDAADEAFTALYKLFGGNKASSGFTFDEDTYKAAKPHFERAAQKFKEFIGDTRELVNRMVAHMRDTLKWPREVMANMAPYLKRFIAELNEPKAQEKAKDEAQPRQQKRESKPAVETENQVTYKPQSKAPGLDTLVPVNMRRSIADALADLEDRVGPIDDFVANELKYKDAAALEEYFGAEQVDALGLAIDNIKRGKGFIIGDQTGIGKGRVNAAIIRWAIVNDRIPMFVTEKPGLYADMYRDLSDIGMGDILPDGPRVLATNTGLKLPLDDAGTVKIDNGDSKAHAKLLMSMATTDANKFFKTHDMIFTNYSQMQTVKGEDTARRQFMEAVAPNAVMIFDESHNAGGQKTRGKTIGPANRSGFARKLVQTANGVFYSSATYAKRPDVMDLYAATDMAMAVDDLDHLAEAIQRGGVPMQQVVATMLSEAGQYIRRERSFDGITYNTPQVEVNRENYDQISYGLSAIQELSKHVAKAAENLTEILKSEGTAMGYDNATGEAGASSTSFTAVMHNVISQLLLAMKVEPAAQMAIAALKRGEKPVLTVANTMESFLSDYADTLGISPGEEMPADFSDVLMKYLDRTRTVIIKKPFAAKGEKQSYRHFLTDAELGGAGLSVYNKAKAIIAGMDLSDLPVSPIDHLKGQLQKAGYKVGEITGRGMVVDYTGDVPVLRTRSGSETSTKGRNATRFKFNNGDIDAIVINQAGSTGISMHASERVKDKSKRHMFIVQPEGNIDTHMQLLGRVNRTGQVVLPEYSQLVAAIPAEKRPAAVLAKKMASLNANTTASRSSAVTAKDVPDFINEYGDEVAISYLTDNFDMNPRLAFPVKISETGKFDKDDAMRKLTGRIPLLPLKEQEDVYEALEGEYAALLQQLEAAGENALEAKTVDLKAKTLTRSTVQEERNKSGSPFAAPVVVEKVSIIRPGKPYKPHELMSRVSAELGGQPMPENMDIPTLANMMQDLANTYRVWGKQAIKKEFDERKSVTDDFNSYTRPILDEIDDGDKRTKEIDKFNAVKNRWTAVHELVPIGRRVTLKTASGNLLGIVIKVEQKGNPKNPMALSTWKVTFAVPDATRTVTLPFSRVTEDGKSDPDSVLDVEVVPMPQWQEKFTDTLERFARKQTEAREERYIATGNLLSAYDWLDRKGAILNYTDTQGHIRQGILTSRDFDLAEHAIDKGKQLTDPKEIRTWLDANQNKYMNGGQQFGKTQIEIGRESSWSDKYVIVADKSKRVGGRFYLDKDLTELTGDFYSLGGKMSVTIPPQKIEKAIKRMIELGAKFKIPTVAPKEETVDDDPMPAMARNFTLTPEAEAHRGQIEELLEKIIRKLVGDHVDVKFENGPIKIEGELGWGKMASGYARGLFWHYARTIQLAMVGNERDLASTAFHEAFHAMEVLLMTPRERLLMERETERLRAIVQRQEGYTKEQIDGLSDSEVRAIAFENYATMRATGKTKGGYSEQPHVGIRRLFDRMMTFLRELANGLRGLGFKTYEDIFNEAFEGRYSNRKPGGYGEVHEQPMAAVMRGPGGPNSFDNTIGDIVGARISRLLPDFIADRNATEARVQLQDKFIRVKKVEESVQQPVPTHESAYQAESLYYGRTGQRLEQLEKNHIDPLIAEIKGNGLTIDEVNDDLYARHAQERNEKIGYQYPANHPFHQAIYDHSLVGASGMSTDEANAILARHMGRVGNFDAVHARVQDIIRRTRDTLLNTGLITQETYDDWRRQYKNYVPLRGFVDGTEDETAMRTGRGYDIRGKEAKKAFGRKSEADGPLNYILLQAEMAIVRGEKNRVGNTMLRFVQSNPDPDRWEVNKPKIIHTIDKNTGLITTMPDNFSDYNDPNVFITKVGGKPYRIRFKGADGANVARALNNMGATSLHSVVKLFAVLTRTMAKLATQLNPEFTIPNFVRDVGEAFINLQEQQQRDFVKSYAKHVLPAVKGAALATAGKTNPNDPYVQAFLEMDRAGGRIRFFGLENPDDINRNIASKMRRLEGGAINSMRDMVEKMGTAVEVINGGVENGVRLATYMAARDVGLSIAESAAIGRNITVDFNRSGEIGGAIGAFYMFYNAAAQGTARTLKAVQSKYVRRAFYTVAAIGAVSALYGIAAGGDSDDGESFFSKIPDYDRNKNFIIMWPKGMGHDGQYVKIPVSFGLAGVFQALGSRLVSVLYGGEKPGKALMSLLGVVANTFDPTGGDENLVAKAFPSVLRGQVHIETNKNWTGKPLYPDNSWDKTKPDSQKSFRSDSAFSKAAAAKINEWTGGNKYEPGAIDMHPASIDHWLQTITGGVGRFASGVASTATGLARGEEWEATKTPILRRFVGNVNTAQSDNAAYYEARNPERAKQEQISRAKKDLQQGVNVDESAKFIEENSDTSKGNIFKRADKQMSRLRKQEQQIINDTSLPEDEKKAQIKELRGQMREIQNDARKQVRELRQGQ